MRIAGTTYDVVRLAERYRVEEIFVTMPSANKKIQSAVIDRCKDCKRPVKVLPGIYQLADGQVTVSKLRKVEIQDLLGREQVKVNLDEIMGYIEDKIVLVTGGRRLDRQRAVPADRHPSSPSAHHFGHL